MASRTCYSVVGRTSFVNCSTCVSTTVATPSVDSLSDPAVCSTGVETTSIIYCSVYRLVYTSRPFCALIHFQAAFSPSINFYYHSSTTGYYWTASV